MSRLPLLSRLLVLLVPLGAPVLARAESEPSAAERTTAARAAFPRPQKPLRFEGDVVLDGRRVGRVRYAAEPARLEDADAWLVKERFVRQAGAARVSEEHEVWLAPDLSVLRGKSSYESPTEDVKLEYRSYPSGVRVSAVEADGGKTTVGHRPDRTVTMGTTALLLFLRQVPAGPGTWFLPLLDPRLASNEAHADRINATLEVAAGGAVKVTTPRGEAYEVRFAPDSTDRALAEIVGEMPRLSVVGAGQGGPAPEWFQRVEEPSQSAEDAFVRFGRGYHMPDRALLEKAFHWPSVLAHDVKAGSWNPKQPVEELREAYVSEFEKMSKHRTEADCDDLLVQTMMFAKRTSDAEGRVTLTTHPAYGGHAYTMADVGGEWFIVAVD